MAKVPAQFLSFMHFFKVKLSSAFLQTFQGLVAAVLSIIQLDLLILCHWLYVGCWLLSCTIVVPGIVQSTIVYREPALGRRCYGSFSVLLNLADAIR